MTRALQNRLALANVKIRHGWQDQPLDILESKIDMELKRKRPSSSNDVLSDASSTSSRSRFYPIGVLDSSPLGAPMFSDDVARSGGSQGYSKRIRYQQQQQNQQQQAALLSHPASSSHARTKVRNGNMKASSWKKTYRLPESSPAYRNRHSSFHISHTPSLSFVSETSTVPDELASPISSEDDDTDLPIHSFNLATSRTERLPTIHSSPPPRSPRTPPPTLARSARLKQKGFTVTADRNPATGEEGAADLLMFLATSPSPANASQTPKNKTRFVAPSTPPSKATPLPSSMMNTPGAAAFAGLSTPGMNFNFADYLNVTPSPAQVAWRTPGLGMTPATRTPKAAREARRRLNYDGGPHSTDKDEKARGLGMEFV